MKKKSNFLRNVTILLKYYYKDAFHGIAKQEWLKNTIMRRLFIFILCAFYVVYLGINILEASRVRGGILTQDSGLIDHALRYTFGSVTSANGIYGLFVALIVFMTFSLTPSSLYVSKVMNFSRIEVHFAQIIFKMSVASIIFLLLLLVEISAISAIPMHAYRMVELLLLSFFAYIAVYVGIDLILSFISSFPGKYGALVLFISTVSLAIIGVYFLFDVRFQIDYWIANQLWSMNTIVAFLFVSTTICLLAGLLLRMFFIFNMHTRESNRYVHIRIPAKNIVSFVVSAFIREKLFLLLLILDVCITIYLLIKNGYEASADILPFLMASFTIAAIRYGDTTSHMRPILKTLRWNYIYEGILLTVIYTMFLIPAISVIIYKGDGLTTLMQFYSLFFSAVIIGFLFPKSGGNTNETVSVVMMVCVLVSLV
ncbi:MAG: hypothetical protein J6M18_00060, partial [Actinomycetaceae bacterium]|nr:hypothetical protein [Actinomycetaceae bacterium]